MENEINTYALVAAGAMVVVFSVMLVAVLKCYRKAGPNQAIIITGAYIPGGSKVVIDDGVVGTASIQVKVLKNEQSVLLAAQQFLSQGAEGVARATGEVVKGHLSVALSRATAMDLSAMGLEIVSFSVRQEPVEKESAG
jgi:uncharacterized membrane protein YqiK